MIFKLNPSAAQPVYLQIVQQVRHAVETGILRDRDALPSIRALAEQLVVSPNTIAKAYSELEHGGLLDLRHGSGAYIISNRRTKSRADRIRAGQERVREFLSGLRDEGFSDEEIERMFSVELFYQQTRRR